MVIVDFGRQPGRNSRNLQNSTLACSQQHRTGHSRAADVRLCCDGIEQGVLDGCISTWHAPEQQPFDEEGNHLSRMLSRFVNAPKCSYRQRRTHGSRQAFAGHIADVHANRAVGEHEIII